MRSILISIIFLAIVYLFWSFRGWIVRVRSSQTERGGENGRPGKITRCIEILGVKPGASEEEVTQAYRDLAKVWHPDRFADNSRLQKKAEEKLKEVNAAYEYTRSFYKWK